MNKYSLPLYFLSFCMPVSGYAERNEQLLEHGWKFSRSDSPEQSAIGFDDSKWQNVRVPHDWAIYGPFSWDNDKQNVAISQDGQKEAMEHAGRTGGLPFVGTGWYRLSVDLSSVKESEKAFLIFDGAMSHAKLFVNGKEVGEWPYGYNSFWFDITPYINRNGENVIAVRLENLPESSRWYPGAGLYRNVHLRTTSADAYFPIWGQRITTPTVTDAFARVVVETEVERKDASKPYQITTVLRDRNGKEVARVTTPASEADYRGGKVRQELVIDNPQLWSPESPNLYTAESILALGNEVSDRNVETFGVRTIEIVPDKGFFLNGKPLKFKGVCQHHDLGMLGAAVNDAAIRRQIRILKDMGVNAIRTSHNMPAPELVKAADEMGVMLMAETFDEWKKPKVKNGYNLLFDEWAEKDLVNLIRHYGNSPSIVMWCIGNEVSEQWHEGDCKTALWLQNIVKREDPTRFVTQGMDAPDAVTSNNFAAVMEVPGFNYRPFKYQQNYAKLPQRIILGTETASTVSSRGVYKFPVERKAMATYDDHQSSSYDVEHCGWSNLPEDDFIVNEDLPYSMGEFIWTGFDYLGEPTPYYTNWPSHSSLFGAIDLGGIPKDRYYLYRSHWMPDSATLHIVPHWTFPGREGKVTPIFVYTNYPEAELFINGVSQGRRKKDLSIGIDSTYTDKARAEFVRQKRYRLMWMDTRYQPGEVKVVAYDKNGNPAETKTISTAGKPYAIKLSVDRSVISADTRDLAFIRVNVVDRQGRLVPYADNQIHFSVSGAGKYEAAASGNPASIELFQNPYMKVFNGQLTAVVRSADIPGTITFKASAKGLKSASVNIETK